MTELTSLDIYFDSIESLTGLEYATNLETISIQEANLEDVSALSDLQHLSTINFADNFLDADDVEVFATLPSLTNLDVSGNYINDLNSLAGATNLTSLAINEMNSNFAFSDLSVISQLTNLTTLKSSDNPAMDLTTLSSSSLKYLDIDNSQVANLDFLYNVPNLETLSASGNNIDDITSIQGASGLRNITLNNNKIEDITPIANMKNAYMVALNANNISDITPVCGLNLNSFDASQNKIAGIPNTPECIKTFNGISGQLSEEKTTETVYVSQSDFDNSIATTNFDVYNYDGTLVDPILDGSFGYSNGVIDWTGHDITVDKPVNYSNGDSNFPIQGTVRYSIVLSNPPVISGIEDTVIEHGTNFDPLEGVTATDDIDGDITNSVEVEGSVDTQTLGDYYLTYSITNSNQMETKVERKVTVVDTQVPVFSGVSDKTIEVGTNFNPMSGVTAIDNVDGDITADIFVKTGTLNTDAVGKYTITYTVTDSSNNTATADRVITVESDTSGGGNEIVTKPGDGCTWTITANSSHDGINYCKRSNGVVKQSTRWSNGVAINKVWYDTKGKVDYKWFYSNTGAKTKYEDWSNGHHLQVNTYKSGKVYGKFYYDTKGKQTKYQQWKSGKRVQTNTYKNGKVYGKFYYDTKGNQTKYQQWNNGHRVQTNTYKNGKVYGKFFYNTRGEQTKYQQWKSGKLVQVNEYTNGKLVKKTFYDTHGNRTRVEIWKNGKRTKVYNY